MPSISIIIPVFNAEKYIEECLQSISEQSFNDFEILAINDGSTDASLAILEQYQQREGRLRIFSQENSGVSAARNLGLENAEGDYITFVDADDWLHPHALETYIKVLREEDFEIVISQFLLEKNENIVEETHVEVLERQEIEQRIFPQFISSDDYNSVCNKLYKKELIQKAKAKFPIGVALAEDAQFNHQVFSLARKISKIDFKSYYYREVAGSATKNVVRNDYLQSNISIFEYDYSKYFGGVFSDSEILHLKKQRFYKSIIALIYIYFHPGNSFSIFQKFSKIKEIIHHGLVKEIFSDSTLKTELGKYDLAIFNAIHSKSILKLYLYTLYSYYRNL